MVPSWEMNAYANCHMITFSCYIASPNVMMPVALERNDEI